MTATTAARGRAEPRPTTWSPYLAGLGGLAFLGYLAINILVPLLPRKLASPRAELNQGLPLWAALTEWSLPIPDTDAAAVSLVVSTTALTFGCYLLALRLSRRIRPVAANLSIVMGVMVFSCLTSVLTLAHFTNDLYMYILYERVLTVHHANPYVVPPAAFENDPYLKYGDPTWIWTTMPYGPVWTYLSSLWGPLASDDMIRRVLLYRTLLFGFNVANALLLWRILQRVNPAYCLTGLIFYAWNPIVIVTGQRHIEPVMVFFLILSIWLWTRQRLLAAPIALTLSALTKFVTAPLLLITLAGLWRYRSWRSALFVAGLIGGVGLLAVLPLLGDGSSINQFIDGSTAGGPNMLRNPRRLLGSLVLIGVTAWVAWNATGRLPELLSGWSVVLLCFGLLVMPPVYAWYLLPLIAVVSLVTTPAIVALTLTLSGSVLLNYMLGTVILPPQVVIGAIWWLPSVLMMLWLARYPLTGLGRSLRIQLNTWRQY